MFQLSYFNFNGTKAGLFKGNPPFTFILKEELIQYLYNLIQFLSNLSKIMPGQKTANIFLQMLTSFAVL